MTSKNKHMARSRRSHNISKSVLGSVARSTYYSSMKKDDTLLKFIAKFKPKASKAVELKDKLKDSFSKMFGRRRAY